MRSSREAMSGAKVTKLGPTKPVTANKRNNLHGNEYLSSFITVVPSAVEVSVITSNKHAWNRIQGQMQEYYRGYDSKHPGAKPYTEFLRPLGEPLSTWPLPQYATQELASVYPQRFVLWLPLTNSYARILTVQSSSLASRQMAATPCTTTIV
jgi:hypothetical protein